MYILMLVLEFIDESEFVGGFRGATVFIDISKIRDLRQVSDITRYSLLGLVLISFLQAIRLKFDLFAACLSATAQQMERAMGIDE